MSRLKRLSYPEDLKCSQRLVSELSAATSSDLPLPKFSDIRFDVNLIYRLYELQKLKRFYGQTHWEQETNSVGRAPGNLDLENVAAHSYHVARCALLIAPHFPWLDCAHTMELALMHDEPEIVTGDKDPVGADGQGKTTHAFNPGKRREKDDEERRAIEHLAAEMRPSIRDHYRRLFAELIEGSSEAARFVKAVDKLQSLAFVRLKKAGNITPEHAAFTLRYSRIGVQRFPQLQGHFMLVYEDILGDIASVKQDCFDDFCALTWSYFLKAENA
ncbi:HD domain-containing protein [Agrobacterium vitis]